MRFSLVFWRVFYLWMGWLAKKYDILPFDILRFYFLLICRSFTNIVDKLGGDPVKLLLCFLSFMAIIMKQSVWFWFYFADCSVSKRQTSESLEICQRFVLCMKCSSIFGLIVWQVMRQILHNLLFSLCNEVLASYFHACLDFGVQVSGHSSRPAWSNSLNQII